MPIRIELEPAPQTARRLKHIGVPAVNVAQVIAEAIIEAMATDPTIPHYQQDDIRSGWQVIKEWRVRTEELHECHFAVAANTQTLMPEEESLHGPRPYDIALGVEFGHSSHWVAFAPKRLGRRVRTKLVAWVREKGTPGMKAALEDFEAGNINAAVHLPDYIARPFVRPAPAKYIQQIEAKLSQAITGLM